MSKDKRGGGVGDVASVLAHKKVMKSKRELWLFRVPSNFDASSLRFLPFPSTRPLRSSSLASSSNHES